MGARLSDRAQKQSVRKCIVKWVLVRCWLCFSSLKSLICKPQWLNHAKFRFLWPRSTATLHQRATIIETIVLHLYRLTNFYWLIVSTLKTTQLVLFGKYWTELDLYTGAGHIIRISSKSWFISLIPFKKWNLYNVYIHSTQTDIFQVFISFNFDDYTWQLMKTPNSVSQKIRILWKGSILKTPGATL